MSKNHYLNLKKDDILFVNNGKKTVAMYLFDGTDFQKLTVEAERVTEGTLNTDELEIINLEVDSIKVAQAIASLSEVKQKENMDLEALKGDVNTLANEISQLKSRTNGIVK